MKNIKERESSTNILRKLIRKEIYNESFFDKSSRNNPIKDAQDCLMDCMDVMEYYLDNYSENNLSRYKEIEVRKEMQKLYELISRKGNQFSKLL